MPTSSSAPQACPVCGSPKIKAQPSNASPQCYRCDQGHVFVVMKSVLDLPRILSISYDDALLVTRQMLLETRGYVVVSAEGFADAIDKCASDFDVVIMGHSIPQKDKRAIVAELHRHGCDAHVVSAP